MWNVGLRRAPAYLALSSASTMASCSAGRIWRMPCAARLGQVRLVSSVTESWRVGSIHSEVPVNPRCPKDDGLKYFPDDDGCDGVSQPKAREVPCGDRSRFVNRATVAGCRMGAPPRNMHSANRATSIPGANSLRGRDPAHYKCILVIDLALDNSLAKCPVILGGRDLRALRLSRMEAGARHAEGREDFLRRELVERNPGDALQQFAEQDESDVAVLRAFSRDRRPASSSLRRESGRDGLARTRRASRRPAVRWRERTAFSRSPPCAVRAHAPAPAKRTPAECCRLAAPA